MGYLLRSQRRLRLAQRTQILAGRRIIKAQPVPIQAYIQPQRRAVRPDHAVIRSMHRHRVVVAVITQQFPRQRLAVVPPAVQVQQPKFAGAHPQVGIPLVSQIRPVSAGRRHLHHQSRRPAKLPQGKAGTVAILGKIGAEKDHQIGRHRPARVIFIPIVDENIAADQGIGAWVKAIVNGSQHIAEQRFDHMGIRQGSILVGKALRGAAIRFLEVAGNGEVKASRPRDRRQGCSGRHSETNLRGKDGPRQRPPYRRGRRNGNTRPAPAAPYSSGR